MTATEPTRKDTAEFFRLCLLAGICDPVSVAEWAERIVAADTSPHIAFIELCISASQSSSAVQSMLGEVPGHATPELPIRMLLGHASRLIADRAFDPEQLLLRLYRLARAESFPEDIYFEFVRLEDDYSCARDRVFGTVAEVIQHFSTFLADYDQYAPTT